MKITLKYSTILLASGLAATAIAWEKISLADRGEIARADAIATKADEMRESPHAKDDFEDKLRGSQLIRALKRGGYVIFLRHAQTERNGPNRNNVNLNVNDCSTQRVLSEKGWQDARKIGTAFASLNLPVGEVYSSQYCRTWQTADLAFGKYEKLAALNPAEGDSEEQLRARILPLFTNVPNPNMNVIFVGHSDGFKAVTRIHPSPQGVAFILKTDERGSLDILANLTPDEWESLKE